MIHDITNNKRFKFGKYFNWIKKDILGEEFYINQEYINLNEKKEFHDLILMKNL